jgi:O-antigen/teichoic acid export membrane protein
MIAVRGSLVRKFVWTAATFGLSSGIRFAQNVALSRLLTPQILGVMVVVNAVRLGIELLSDVGIEQNVVHHEDGLTKPFRETAWTMQVARGVMLSLFFAAMSVPLAHVYKIDVRIFLVASLMPVLNGMHSIAIFALVRQLDVRRRTLFELSAEGVTFVASVAFAVAFRSIWSPILGVITGVVYRSAASYWLPESRHRLAIDPAIRRRIMAFGKWIALTSLVMYAATNIDRLYLGRVVPLGYLGVYGIARTIAELPTMLARRLSYQIIFPAFARGEAGNLSALTIEIGHTRRAFVVLAAFGLALAAGCGDWLIILLYDPRYHAAGWMLSVLFAGGIFALLSNLNEALLLGAGRPGFSSFASLARLATLAVGIVAGFRLAGLAGVILAIALTEVLQYAYIGCGMCRLRVGFWLQDLAATAIGAATLAGVVALREWNGLGSPFAGMF